MAFSLIFNVFGYLRGNVLLSDGDFEGMGGAVGVGGYQQVDAGGKGGAFKAHVGSGGALR